MSDLLLAGRALALDLASTLLFMAVLALGGSLAVAVGLAVTLAAGQIGWAAWRGRKIDTLQWTSLAVVVVSGGASLVTRDPRFVMLKPTLLYGFIGAAMLQPGWMRRYMPQKAVELMPDIIVTSGQVWAGLMLFTAALNLVLVLTVGVTAWAAAMAIWGTASKLGLFLAQFALMKSIGRRRYRALHPPAVLAAQA